MRRGCLVAMMAALLAAIDVLRADEFDREARSVIQASISLRGVAVPLWVVCTQNRAR